MTGMVGNGVTSIGRGAGIDGVIVPLRRAWRRCRGGLRSWLLPLLALAGLNACNALSSAPPPPSDPVANLESTAEYIIGPLDTLQIFVWRSTDLSVTVPVRPDGRVSLPLVGEIVAAGKTPQQLTDQITTELLTYVQNPVVSVIVSNFGNASGQTVQVVGEAARPVAVPYRAGMKVLDVMVAVGGLTEEAIGNDALLIRGRGEAERVYGLRLEDLLNRGQVALNVPVLPGDVIMIPKGFF